MKALICTLMVAIFVAFAPTDLSAQAKDTTKAKITIVKTAKDSTAKAKADSVVKAKKVDAFINAALKRSLFVNLTRAEFDTMYAWLKAQPNNEMTKFVRTAVTVGIILGTADGHNNYYTLDGIFSNQASKKVKAEIAGVNAKVYLNNQRAAQEEANLSSRISGVRADVNGVQYDVDSLFQETAVLYGKADSANARLLDAEKFLTEDDNKEADGTPAYKAAEKRMKERLAKLYEASGAKKKGGLRDEIR